jgi:hypothetical protein
MTLRLDLEQDWVQLQMTGDPADDLWHIVNLNVDPSGSVAVTVVQTLQQGNSSTIL